jgi:hypothetical protein
VDGLAAEPRARGCARRVARGNLTNKYPQRSLSTLQAVQPQDQGVLPPAMPVLSPEAVLGFLRVLSSPVLDLLGWVGHNIHLREVTAADVIAATEPLSGSLRGEADSQALLILQ